MFVFVAVGLDKKIWLSYQVIDGVWRLTLFFKGENGIDFSFLDRLSVLLSYNSLGA